MFACRWLALAFGLAAALTSSIALAGPDQPDANPPAAPGAPSGLAPDTTQANASDGAKSDAAKTDPARVEGAKADGAKADPKHPGKAGTHDEGPIGVAPEDARGTSTKPGITAEDVGLFVPRAIFFIPARAIGLVTTPLRGGMVIVEKHHIIDRVIDFLYNDDRTAAIVPLITLSTFFGAQIGVRAFHNDLGGKGIKGSLKASWGVDKEQVYAAQLIAPHVGGTPLFIESLTSFENHPSLRYFGFGGDAPALAGSNLDPRKASELTFYRQQRFRQLLTLGGTIGKPGGGRELKLGVRSRFKRSDFDKGDGLKKGDRSLEDVYDTSKVPGYDNGATTAELEGFVTFDLRDAKGATAHGFYLDAFGGGAMPFGFYRYAHFGGEMTGYIDLYHKDRVLVLRLANENVAGANDRIPFSEMPYLGGPHFLRGYDLFRYRAEKTLVGTVEYHYPIHEMISGSLFCDVGEANSEFTGLFKDAHFHVGGGFGLIVRSKDKVLITLDVAGGDGVQVYLTTDPLRAFTDRDSEL